MELDDLKALWKEENKILEEKLRLREETIRKMNLDKAVSEFDKLLHVSLLGRNLALLYCLISFGLAWQMMAEIEYSIPAIIGGLAMFWSFTYHLKIEKPDYNHLSVIDLQKFVQSFRIHSASSAKYDVSVVGIWLLTLAPVVLRLFFNTSIYTSSRILSIFCLVSFAGMLCLIFFTRKVYQLNDQKLKKLESQFIEIIKFEKDYINQDEMKTPKSNLNFLHIIVGMFSVLALLFIATAGYHFGIWLKGIL